MNVQILCIIFFDTDLAGQRNALGKEMFERVHFLLNKGTVGGILYISIHFLCFPSIGQYLAALASKLPVLCCQAEDSVTDIASPRPATTAVGSPTVRRQASAAGCLERSLIDFEHFLFDHFSTSISKVTHHQNTVLLLQSMNCSRKRCGG